jgi:diaminopimelate epimerase
MRFAKGHGTENDFVILPDPDGILDLSPRLVARLCDRRAGLGGDGVLRVVRTAAMAPHAADPQASPGHPASHPASHAASAALAAPAEGPACAASHVTDPPADAAWFMDYRNADGGAAEMCGNGIRVFARYLLETGLAVGDEFTIATRGGPRLVRVRQDGGISADMGAARVLGPGSVTLGGRVCHGLRISVGNPHLACIVDTPLDEFDLSSPPELDHDQFPEGANVEIVRVTGGATVRMRVRERGSGETRSCGTGAVAAAVAAAGGGDGTWRVDVPGGELTVTLNGTASWLTGPAVIVADGELRGAWLSVPELAR